MDERTILRSEGDRLQPALLDRLTDDEPGNRQELLQNSVVSKGRLKRTVFSRVPHYQSDAALQAQWEAMRAAGSLPVMPGAPQVVPAQP